MMTLETRIKEEACRILTGLEIRPREKLLVQTDLWTSRLCFFIGSCFSAHTEQPNRSASLGGIHKGRPAKLKQRGLINRKKGCGRGEGPFKRDSGVLN